MEFQETNPKVMQCPAVSMCRSVMMAPPQCSLGPSMRDTSQGYACGCTVVPPTILRLVPEIPHSGTAIDLFITEQPKRYENYDEVFQDKLCENLPHVEFTLPACALKQKM